MKHTTCGTTITHVIRLADDGHPVILRWCPTCEDALNEDECDPPLPITVDEAGADIISQLIAIHESTE